MRRLTRPRAWRADGRAQSNAEEFFDGQAERWPDLYASDPQFGRRFALLTSLIGAELSGTEPGLALDAGCGTGTFSAYLAELGWTVKAVDSSVKMLDRAASHLEERLGARKEAVSLQRMDIEDLAFESESFDLVLCLSTVEYVEDDVAGLRGLVRLLKRGGLLVISVPNRRSVVRIIERSMRRLRRMTGHTAPYEAFYLDVQRHQYAPEELDTLLHSLGLVKRTKRFWSVGFSKPSRLLPLFERAWWAGMYGAVYVKGPSS